MATAPCPSAFCGLRETRRTLGSRILMVGLVLTRSLRHPDALAGAVDLLREVSRLLNTLAIVEDRLVFPCLERWLAKYSGRIQIARLHRVRVEQAVGGLMAIVGGFVSHRSASQAGAMQNAASHLALLFHDWVILEEAELFTRCDIDLGALGSRLLGGRIELLLADDPTTSRVAAR